MGASNDMFFGIAGVRPCRRSGPQVPPSSSPFEQTAQQQDPLPQLLRLDEQGGPHIVLDSEVPSLAFEPPSRRPQLGPLGTAEGRVGSSETYVGPGC